MRYWKSVLVILLVFVLILFINNYITNNSFPVFQRDFSRDFLQDQSLKIMTYNIQHGVGLDGNLNLERTAEVLKTADAGIIGLNEVDNKMYRSNFKNQIKILSNRLKMNYVFGANIDTIFGNYGNGLLTKFPVKKIDNHKLPGEKGKEPRGLLEAEVLISPVFSLKVLVTHLSLETEERNKQWQWILQHINSIEGPFVLMGDFNFQENLVEASDYFIAAEKTFPADSPVKEIDMFFSNSLVKKEIYTINSIASDHLPLIVEMHVENFEKQL
ncbi:MAG: endonuclease/exonuclease/phosphatase family protein [bacterium]